MMRTWGLLKIWNKEWARRFGSTHHLYTTRSTHHLYTARLYTARSTNHLDTTQVVACDVHTGQVVGRD